MKIIWKCKQCGKIHFQKTYKCKAIGCWGALQSIQVSEPKFKEVEKDAEVQSWFS